MRELLSRIDRPFRCSPPCDSSKPSSMAPARISIVATLAFAATVAAAATNNPRPIQAADAAPATAGAASYLRNVKPLFQQRCFACHGALKQQAGLRLDTAAAILRGGDSGPAIVRGDSAKSLLVARVTAMEKSERMPPEHEGECFRWSKFKRSRIGLTPPPLLQPMNGRQPTRDRIGRSSP